MTAPNIECEQHADALYEFHRQNGVDIIQPPGDREYELRDYNIRDLHGYVLSFGHRLHDPCEEGDQQ